MTRGFARGKVILFGEHAVVYGTPAIAAGLERGVTAHAERSDTARLMVGERCLAPDDSLGARAFEAILDALGAPSMRVTIDVEIPLGAGLGGSAAIGVATARAVVAAQGGDPDLESERVLGAADAWERAFHGNPSGIDVRASALGGCIWYTRDGGPRGLRVARELHLAVAIAGPPASTREMVESVAQLKRQRPDTVDKCLAGIDSLVHNARACIEEGHLADLGKLMDLNQMLLAGLFLSTEDIERACRVAREAGALGAKLTGAGGGGCVVALTDGDTAPVLAAWTARGIDGFGARVRAAPGVAVP